MQVVFIHELLAQTLDHGQVLTLARPFLLSIALLKGPQPWKRTVVRVSCSVM